MKNITKNQIIDLIQNISHINQELNSTAKYETKSSEYLVGVVGGGIGLFAGALINLIGVASTAFLSPIGLFVGVAGAILLWRGKEQHEIERATKKNNSTKSKILADIRSLPDNAPQESRKKLWESYDRATEKYEMEALPRFLD